MSFNNAAVCLKAATRMAVSEWMMARSEIWIQDECQVNILLLSAETVIHSWIAARRETWKPFTSLFSLLISRSLACILSITIAHLFSFVSPLVSPFNPFSFPLSSLYSCFHFNPISQSSPTAIRHPFHQPSDKLCLTSSTCLSSFSFFSFNLPFFVFPPLPLPSQTSRYWHILSASFSLSIATHAPASTLSGAFSSPLFLSPSILSKNPPWTN